MEQVVEEFLTKSCKGMLWDVQASDPTYLMPGKGYIEAGKQRETLEKELRAEKAGGPELKAGKWLVETLPALLMSMVR